MATIAVGDIHGNIHALDDILNLIGGEVAPGDTIVFLGDYIDRGPASKECIDRLLDFRSGSTATVVFVLGNHEEWMLRSLRDPTRHSWLLGMEAFDTIASYSAAAATELRRAAEEAGRALLTDRIALPYDVFFSTVPAAHLAFFESLLPSHRTPEAIFSHGGLDPRIRGLERQPPHTLIWGGPGFPDSYDGDDRVVYGHWDNAVTEADGWPKPCVGRRTIGIDTISHGVLTALRLPDVRLFQSRRHRVGSSGPSPV